jgi:hypothetical protein
MPVVLVVERALSIGCVWLSTTQLPTFPYGLTCMMFYLTRFSAVACVCLSWLLMDVSTPAARGGVVYSAVADFSLAGNPNGVWSYRQGLNTSVLLTNTYSDASVQTWSGSFSTIYGNFPYVAKNVSGSTLAPFWTTDLLAMHPSESLIPSVVRWTAPLSGTYRVQGRFQNVTSATSDVYIYQNTTSILSGALSGNSTPPVTFDQLVTVGVGDFLEFAAGAQGNWGGDGVGLAAVISPHTPPPAVVPEPSSLVIACTLGLGFALRRRWPIRSTTPT